LIKTITKKLKLKINRVTFRHNNSFRGFDRLKTLFPKLDFYQCHDEDTVVMRDVSNTASLLGWMFCFQESIWQWSFPELANGAIGTRQIHDNMNDPGFRSGQICN
jgi:hypothetical protein